MTQMLSFYYSEMFINGHVPRKACQLIHVTIIELVLTPTCTPCHRNNRMSIGMKFVSVSYVPMCFLHKSKTSFQSMYCVC